MLDRIGFVPMNKNASLKVLSLFLILLFTFFFIGADFLHNHTDAEYHNDCPVCQWLIISLFSFTITLILLGLFLTFEHFFLYVPEVFITKSYLKFLYLRSPQAFV